MDANISDNIQHGLQSQIEQFINSTATSLKEEMLLIMNNKLIQLKKDLKEVDNVEALQTYISSNTNLKMSDVSDQIDLERQKQQQKQPPSKHESISLEELNQCIDYIHSQAVNSFDRDALKKFIPFSDMTQIKKETNKINEAATTTTAAPRVRRNATKANEKTIASKASKSAQPLGELNGHEIASIHRPFTRKQASKETATNIIKRPKKLSKTENVIKDENENICEQIDPPPQKKTLSRLFKDKLFGVNNDSNCKNVEKTTTDNATDATREDIKPSNEYRTTKLRRDLKVNKFDDKNDPDSDGLASDSDQPRPFALTRNMWERRSLKNGTKFPVLK